MIIGCLVATSTVAAASGLPKLCGVGLATADMGESARTFQLGVFILLMGSIMIVMVVIVVVGMLYIERQKRHASSSQDGPSSSR